MKPNKTTKRWCSAALAALMLLVCASFPYAEQLKTVLLGDANRDGEITAEDARAALRFAVTLDAPEEMDVEICDIDGDGVVDSGDARVILRAAVGLEDLNGKIAGVKLEVVTTAAPSTTQPPTTEPPTTQPPTTQRWSGSIDDEAYASNWYLSESQMRVNASLIKRYLSAKGWSLNSICALLGNMELESTINPGIYERGGSGYGLVQWTPGSMYRNWAARNGYADDSMEGELEFLIYTMSPYSPIDDIIWFKELAPYDYRESSYEFTHSYESVGYLTLVFMHCYERPGIRGDSRRVAAAERWYAYFT